MLQHVMSSADALQVACRQVASCWDIWEKIIGVLHSKLKESVSPFCWLLKKSSLEYQWKHFLASLSIFLFPCSTEPIHMFHSPFMLFLSVSIQINCWSCSSSSSRSVEKSSGGGKVPERKGKQRDTLHFEFSALPCISG